MTQAIFAAQEGLRWLFLAVLTSESARLAATVGDKRCKPAQRASGGRSSRKILDKVGVDKPTTDSL